MSSIPERRNQERSALAPLGNGKAEWARWALSLLLAAFVAYVTVTARLAAIEATQEARFDEIKRFMQRIDAWVIQQQEKDRRER